MLGLTVQGNSIKSVVSDGEADAKEKQGKRQNDLATLIRLFLNEQVYHQKKGGGIPLVGTYKGMEAGRLDFSFFLVMTCFYLVPFFGGIPKCFRDCLFNISCTYVYTCKRIFLCPPRPLVTSEQEKVPGALSSPSSGFTDLLGEHCRWLQWRMLCDSGTLLSTPKHTKGGSS